MVAPVHAELLPLQASQRYALVDLRRLSQAALNAANNLLAAAFRLEHLRTTSDIYDAIDEWNRLSDASSNGYLRRWGARRLRLLAERRKLDLQGIAVESVTMDVHFDTFVDALRYETKLTGHRERLLALLIKRFGAVSRDRRRRIGAAEMEDLDLWFDRLYDAKNIKEIFAEDQPA